MEADAGATVIPLHRSVGQRVFGAVMAATYAGITVWVIVIGVTAPFTWPQDTGWARWAFAPVALVALIALPPVIAAFWRLTVSPAGRAELGRDAVVLVDAALVRAPVRIPRTMVASIDETPSGWSRKAWRPASKAGAALWSIAGERPNVVIRLREPMRLTGVRRNNGPSGQFPLRPPGGKRPVTGFWLRVDDETDRQRLLAWA